MKRWKTKFLKIIKIPAGEAPLKVRKAWVGLKLPFVYSKPYYIGAEYKLNSLDDSPRRRKDCKLLYAVPKIRAVEILKEKDAKAAQWFCDHVSDKGNFTFADYELELC